MSIPTVAAGAGATRLCRLDDIPEGDGRSFNVKDGPRLRKVLVVRKAGRLYAYRNSCPHAGTPLDWTPHRFFNREKTLLRCQTHDALFRIEDGVCVAGPCAGDGLAPLTVTVEDGDVMLAG